MPPLLSKVQRAGRHNSRAQLLLPVLGLLLLLVCCKAFAAECIVPSKPGGGFDQTCKLARKALEGQVALRLSYM
ncbi:MAG: hypothetical protein ACJ8G3_15890, partial [Burkholderiaceae bacterium]